MTRAISKLLATAQGRVFPAWSAVVSCQERIVFRGAGGDHVDESSMFDLASLTKPLVTATIAMQFVANGRLPLDTPISEVIRSPVAGGPHVTARRLLSHSSGLPAWRPLYSEIPALDGSPESRRERILRAACDTRLVAPPGTQALYSDLNFLILTRALETLGEERLDRLFDRALSPPGLVFRPVAEAAVDRRRSAFVPTERDPTRGVLVGQVNDENAWAMGGVSGHAGLFGTASGVHGLVSRWVDAWHGRTGRTPFEGSQSVCRLFWTRAGEPPGSTWALGWDTPSEHGSSAGKNPPRGAVGHTGFTGASVWVDPHREVVSVLLTNRVWPDRSNGAIRQFRPRFHDAVWDAVG